MVLSVFFSFLKAVCVLPLPFQELKIKQAKNNVFTLLLLYPYPFLYASWTSTLQKQNTENLKQIFLEKELRGLTAQSQFPNLCVSERFIYSHKRYEYSAGK
jgi:hypothetical protein